MSIQRKSPLKLCGCLALAGLGTPDFWPVTVEAAQVPLDIAGGVVNIMAGQVFPPSFPDAAEAIKLELTAHPDQPTGPSTWPTDARDFDDKHLCKAIIGITSNKVLNGSVCEVEQAWCMIGLKKGDVCCRAIALNHQGREEDAPKCNALAAYWVQEVQMRPRPRVKAEEIKMTHFKVQDAFDSFERGLDHVRLGNGSGPIRENFARLPDEGKQSIAEIQLKDIDSGEVMRVNGDGELLGHSTTFFFRPGPDEKAVVKLCRGSDCTKQYIIPTRKIVAARYFLENAKNMWSSMKGDSKYDLHKNIMYHPEVQKELESASKIIEVGPSVNPLSFLILAEARADYPDAPWVSEKIVLVEDGTPTTGSNAYRFLAALQSVKTDEIANVFSVQSGSDCLKFVTDFQENFKVHPFEGDAVNIRGDENHICNSEENKDGRILFLMRNPDLNGLLQHSECVPSDSTRYPRAEAFLLRVVKLVNHPSKRKSVAVVSVACGTTDGIRYDAEDVLNYLCEQGLWTEGQKTFSFICKETGQKLTGSILWNYKNTKDVRESEQLRGQIESWENVLQDSRRDKYVSLFPGTTLHDERYICLPDGLLIKFE